MRSGLAMLLAAVTVVALTAFLTAPEGAPAASSMPTPQATPSARACVPGSLEQRAAQTLVVGLPGGTASADSALAQELTDLQVGGLLLLGSNVESREQVQAFVATMKSRAAIPPLVATDEELGRVSTFRDVLGKTASARQLAERNTPAGLRDLATQLGRHLRTLGIDLNLAPVADLDGGQAGGVIGDRSFSADPQAAAAAAAAFGEGLTDAGLLATAKHFPGHGRSSVDSHVRLNSVDTPLAELRETDLAPFVDQIEAGVPVVMMAHVAFSALGPADLPASLNPRAYQLLRDMGFQGLAITDSLGMGAVHRTWSYTESSVLAMEAGADALLLTDGRKAAAIRDALVAAVRDGRLSESRLDEAAARMLRVKGLDPSGLTCARLPAGPGAGAFTLNTPTPSATPESR